MDELLKYALENGKIDLTCIQEEMEMNRRKDILKKHKQSVWFGTDGYWHTYLIENGARRPVKRKKEKDIQDCIVNHYKKSGEYIFQNRFDVWVERQEICGRSPNTIYKYRKDYQRFFENTDFENKDVRYITSETICKHFKYILSEKEIPYRALKGAFGYLNGVFDKCIIDRVIKENPCQYVDLPIFRKMCIEQKPKTAAQRTVSNEEKLIMLKKFREKPTIAKYAVEFAFYTGMRVGELSSVRWSDIDFQGNVIFVHTSEKTNQFTKESTVENTKNGKERYVPLTDPMKKVLKMVYEEEEKNGWVTEFVFSDMGGRIHAKDISDAANKCTRTQEFSNTKSVHALRRTINSKMRCNGASATLAAAILGHSEQVNERNYTYDVSGYKEKKNILEAAGVI